MPGYKRDLGNGKWRLEVSNGFRPDGKPNRSSKVVEATSERAAEKMLQEFYREFCNKPPQVNNRITFKAFVPVWWERHGDKLSPNCEQPYKNRFKSRLVPYFGNVQLRKITGDMICTFLDDQKRNGKCNNRNQMLSPGEIFNLYKFLRALFNKAVEWGYLSKNPCYDIPKDKRPKKDYRKPSILEEDDLARFLQALFALPDNATYTKHKLFCYLSLLDGGRLGEHMALTWNDIDYENKVIHITKATYFRGEVPGIKAPKTKSSIRDVYIDDVVIELLKKHKAYQEKWLARNNLVNNEGYLFLRTRLDAVDLPSRTMFAGWLRKFLKRNNLPHFGVHGFRRMAASYSAGNNVPLTAIQAMLGHTEIATTNIYLRSLDKKRREGTEVMSNALQSMINAKASEDDAIEEQ